MGSHSDWEALDSPANRILISFLALVSKLGSLRALGRNKEIAEDKIVFTMNKRELFICFRFAKRQSLN